ncbi:Uncharacterized protein TPAR_05961 [Tolypocladium paradoxum]|uniref:Uncharacterized protein n=1 Tax=Tolypocladium paradoxum TaxID=94208 RepID=A0A2S4KUJ8_9HYPO|nr:Uncharacterized protein TPAR_05961 [Tolypocladium paradoxum]
MSLPLLAMNRLFPLTMLVMAPLAQAGFSHLQDRHDTNECCSCPAPGAPNQGVTTVTVTQLAAAPKTETITVQQTVTASITTVTVTPTNNPPAVTLEVTVQPRPEPQTIANGGSPSGSLTPGSPRIVKVAARPIRSTPAAPSLPSESPSRPNKGGDTVVTKTLGNGGNPETGPNVKTVVVSPDPSTMTAPPRVQTVVKSIHQTLTKTVSGGGGDNIEIIIINIVTGKSTCRKKHSGKPCRAGNHSPVPLFTGVPGSSVMNCTSIATTYNTVVVALGTGIPHNATSAMGAAHPTGAGNPMMTTKGRKPRGPLSIRKW